MLQKNFKKIAHALLPSYTLNLVPVHDNEVVANPQASAVNGLKFEVNGVVDGSTAEFSGGRPPTGAFVSCISTFSSQTQSDVGQLLGAQIHNT